MPLSFQDTGLVRVIQADGSEVYAKWMVKQVVGPASYASGGFAVDCSDKFSSIIEATVGRVFQTIGGTDTGFNRLAFIGQDGTDLFSAAKCRILVREPPNHTHTYDKSDTPTGNQSALSAAGISNHTHALTYTSTASGTASATSLAQSTGANFSALTFVVLVLGVPL